MRQGNKRRFFGLQILLLVLTLLIGGIGTYSVAASTGSASQKESLRYEAKKKKKNKNKKKKAVTPTPEAQKSTEDQKSESAKDADESAKDSEESTKKEVEVRFRNQYLLDQHYEKHGIEMGFDSAEAYELAAAAVVNNPDALHKIEQEDGDDIYYLEDTNEFVVVSKDGYLRTYFNPSRGKAYYDKQ